MFVFGTFLKTSTYSKFKYSILKLTCNKPRAFYKRQCYFCLKFLYPMPFSGIESFKSVFKWKRPNNKKHLSFNKILKIDISILWTVVLSMLIITLKYLRTGHIICTFMLFILIISNILKLMVSSDFKSINNLKPFFKLWFISYFMPTQIFRSNIY